MVTARWHLQHHPRVVRPVQRAQLSPATFVYRPTPRRLPTCRPSRVVSETSPGHGTLAPATPPTGSTACPTRPRLALENPFVARRPDSFPHVDRPAFASFQGHGTLAPATPPSGSATRPTIAGETSYLRLFPTPQPSIQHARRPYDDAPFASCTAAAKLRLRPVSGTPHAASSQPATRVDPVVCQRTFQLWGAWPTLRSAQPART